MVDDERPELPVIGWQRFPTLVLLASDWYGADKLADQISRARFSLCSLKLYGGYIDEVWDILWDVGRRANDAREFVYVFPQNEGVYLWLMANAP